MTPFRHFVAVDQGSLQYITPAPRVAYYLPRTLSVEEAARLAPIVEVESQYLNDKL